VTARLGYQHACARAARRHGAVLGLQRPGPARQRHHVQRAQPGDRLGPDGRGQIDGGYYHTCARLAGGTVQCWGYNAYGQLGDGTTTNRTTPVTVSGLSSDFTAGDLERHLPQLRRAP
jgi:hypothetical protein